MTSEDWSTQRLYRPFIRASLIVAITLGFSTGAAILIMPLLGIERSLTWVTHSQSHGIAQLFGWAGLFVMGFAYHVVPRFFRSSIRYPLPQKLSMWLVIAGLLFRFTGQSLYKMSLADPLVAIGGVLLFAGMLVFGWTLYGVIRLSTSQSGSAEIWMISGVFWSVIAGALHLVITLRMAVDSAPLGYAPWNEALIYTCLFGFIASFIFGVSARAIRGFLLLQPMHERTNRISLLLVQLGLLTLIVGRFANLDQGVASTALILASSGAGMFVYALRVLEPSSGPIRRFAVGYARYGWLVRTAYGWLVVGCVMLILTALDNSGMTDLIPVEVSLPIMHVFTLGFVTTLIFGAASRFIPIFEGTDIRHPRLMDVAYVFITISVVLRVGFGFTVSEIGEHALGASGGIGFIGIILFAIVVFQAMTQSARDAYAARAAAFGQVKFEATKTPRSTELNLM
ncbi:MAG: NnrS family protein [Chloroflexi bacterium]|nr:NnrS family protein [Chloroflexota bacterium]